VHPKLFELADGDKLELLDKGKKKRVGRPATKIMEVEQRFGKPLVDILSDNRNLSVRALAEKLNVGKSTVAKWRKYLTE